MTETINQQMSPTIGALAEALSKAQGSFEHAKKTANNPFFKSKYANLADLIDAAKPHLMANGLCVTQITFGNPIMLVTILAHSSNEWIRGEYPVTPVKNDPQGMGSALSYARRYTYAAVTGLATEDDDGAGASDTVVTPVTDKQIAEITKLLSESGADKEKFLKFFEAKEIGELTSLNFQSAIDMLNARKKGKQDAGK